MPVLKQTSEIITCTATQSVRLSHSLFTLLELQGACPVAACKIHFLIILTNTKTVWPTYTTLSRPRSELQVISERWGFKGSHYYQYHLTFKTQKWLKETWNITCYFPKKLNAHRCSINKQQILTKINKSSWSNRHLKTNHATMSKTSTIYSVLLNEDHLTKRLSWTVTQWYIRNNNK